MLDLGHRWASLCWDEPMARLLARFGVGGMAPSYRPFLWYFLSSQREVRDYIKHLYFDFKNQSRT